MKIRLSLALATFSLITQPDQGLTALHNLILSAARTIDITLYELDDPAFQQDLASQAAAGITVRVILDQNLEHNNNLAAFTFLSENGVEVHWANPTYAATHQKTITIDAAYSTAQTAILTLNLTPRYYSTDRDFAVIENDLNDIAAIHATFQSDFLNTPTTPPTGANLVWSPTGSESALLEVIAAARQTLQIENEEISDSAIVNAIAASAQRGVNVQIAMTNTNNEYSSEWNQLTAAGADVATYSPDAALYIHAKVILADAGFASAAAFVGSQNFSSASLTRNRELGLFIHDAAIQSALSATLTSDFLAGAPWPGSPPNFILSASSHALTLTTRQSAASLITCTPFNGFQRAVVFTASGLPSGVTASFSPVETSSGASTSTLTLTANGPLAPGIASIIVTASGGGITRTLPLNLTLIERAHPPLCPASCRATSHPRH